MAKLIMRTLDAALGNPAGFAGRIGGAVMVRVNAAQERWAVDTAMLGRGMQVLVVGPGPGVGLALAAAAVGPTGRVVGVDPSETMRVMASRRCASEIKRGHVELRCGTAEYTGCADSEVDVAISVNNVMLWDLRRGFAELARVLRPQGRVVITVHRHVLDARPRQLRDAAEEAGFGGLVVAERLRRLNSPAVEILATRLER